MVLSYLIRVKHLRVKGLNNCMYHVPTFIWVFKNQPIVTGVLTQPSRCKRAENNLLADEKGP